jgi:hypothetical protein
MKKIYFFLLSFLVFFQFDIVRAQERYSILSTGFGYLFSDRVNGNLSVSFPYHSKDVSTGVEGGWYCPILQRDTVLADQMSSDNRASNVVARVGINDEGASATFNNAKMNKSPLVDGLFVGIRVGYFVKEKRKS